MPQRDDDDAHLARLAARGDGGAFDRLVLLHEARVRSFLIRIVGRADADDVAQEAFVKAWVGLPRRREDAAFGAWLMRIAWTAALDHLRKTRRAQARDFAWQELREDHSRPPGTAQIEVERALAVLDVAERAALVLSEGHGWSHSEAAEILQMPLGTLKSMVRRAKAKVLAVLDGGAE